MKNFNKFFNLKSRLILIYLSVKILKHSHISQLKPLVYLYAFLNVRWWLNMNMESTKLAGRASKGQGNSNSWGTLKHANHPE